MRARGGIVFWPGAIDTNDLTMKAGGRGQPAVGSQIQSRRTVPYNLVLIELKPKSGKKREKDRE